MKIISRFKDYYDHVQHVNGGGDPKVIYHRDFVLPDHESGGVRWERTGSLNRGLAPAVPNSIQTLQDGKIVTHEFRALVVLGRRYIIERSGFPGTVSNELVTILKDWHITKRPLVVPPFSHLSAFVFEHEEVPPGKLSWYQQRSVNRTTEWKKEWKKYQVEQGVFAERFVMLSKELNAPVFVVDSVYVYGRTPKLGELGFVAYYSAEQLYQELAMFVGNTLQPVADPASPMTDIEKVVSHGFDKKKSFRHRT